jgi:cytoskeletal protein CcmA (bactofilin family)
VAESNTEFGTIIGTDASFKGDLTFDSSAKILGKFDGTIAAKGRVHVSDGASCKAKVTAKEVAVEGAIEGTVEATDRVDLKPKGSITGDITAARMTMADGAAIDGHCRIGIDARASGRASTATAEVKPAGQPSQPVQAGKGR